MSSILHLSDRRKYHLYRKETDMRKGFDSLCCGIIRNELNKQLMNGDAFIFINKPRIKTAIPHTVSELAEYRDAFIIYASNQRS